MLFMHTAVAQASYVIAVRSLCEFTARQGDLDLRFTPVPSAQEASPVTGWWHRGGPRTTRPK